MNRRDALKGLALGGCALALPGRMVRAATVHGTASLAALERQYGGRLGVSILDTGSGARLRLHGDQRFLMCSTFKLLAVAAVLARIDAGQEHLDRRIVFGPKDVLAYAPVTSRRVGAPGMSVAELCAAAITVSDNTAANLLLASMGGPAAVTRFVRGIGDPVTRLDRIEPALNVGSPGDERDTTTPDAMLTTMQALLLGRVLVDASRERLLAWLRACSTGLDQLRAGIGPGWTAADKTGSGSQAETNDVAVFFPPLRQPILVTAYYAQSTQPLARRHALLAEIGRIAASV
jgi:beta-lactamase class A